MRAVPQEMTDRWKAQAKTGDQRPVVRATIQIANLRKFDYDTSKAPGGDVEQQRSRSGHYASIVFGDASGLRELRTIKSYSWNRSLDQDVATCTITMANTEITPIGNQDEQGTPDDFDQPGYFTYNRGQQKISGNRWSYHTDTGWQDIIVPDRLVRTYEGYGSDKNVPAALDPNLVQSGTWLIDTVTYNSAGEIVIEMRDIGRLLLEQLVFPPVIPRSEYPLTWEKIHSERVPGRSVAGGSWGLPKGTAHSSNDLYVGKGLTNDPKDHYVKANGSVDGHRAAHALAEQPEEYWLSTGQDTRNSKVWWQVDLDNPTALNAVKIHPQSGPYRIYISLKGPNGWIGKRKIPYDITTGDVDIDANIPFVKSVLADRRYPADVILPRKYGNIEAVRLTFTGLSDRVVGEHPFHAGLKDIKLYTAASKSDLSFIKGQIQRVVGNYQDYTDIVKWCCAWGGFYWPPHSTGLDYIKVAKDDDRFITYASPDPRLAAGRVWGDFMNSGTYGEAPLTWDLFEKKPLMDMINYVRDVLGFIFFIDETGGVVWRMPNLGLAGNPKQGNYLSPDQLGERTKSRTAETLIIDEEETLLDYSTTLSSENLRERIFVGNSTGKIGTVIKGYAPYNTGFRRTAGWTDQHFKTKKEVKVAADMIAAQQMFGYRRSAITIPGYPGVQVDDQIRVFERVTNETYYQYVLGIASELDMETGVWTYRLETHWLGERPSDAWVVRVDQLDAATQSYLNLIDQGA